METLSNGALIVVLQNLQLALDYQHRKVNQDEYDEDDVADIEDYLVQASRVLGEFEAEYQQRIARGANLAPLSEIPRIDL